MDDIISLFNSESDTDKFWHPKIRFTTEKQTENQLSLLDLLITDNGDHFLTSVQRKKLSNIVNIIVKVLISNLFFHRLKLEIYLVLKNQCLSI